MVAFQLLSDLHLEVERGSTPPYIFDFPVAAPNLALLGDIGWTRDDRLFEWLELQLSRFERVFFVIGNHEPRLLTLEENLTRLETFAARFSPTTRGSDGEFILLHRRRYDLNSTLSILGCTLWSALNPDNLDVLSRTLTDFRRIEAFTPTSYTTAHQTDLDWLTSTIHDIRTTEPERRVVVFSHHAPTLNGTSDPKFSGGPTSGAFATELTRTSVWAKPVVLWAFGHTHWCCDFKRDGVRVVANQRGTGIGGQIESFDASKVIVIDQDIRGVRSNTFTRKLRKLVAGLY
ncbi:hypothetical protein M413DRAFT_84237 [Hebeloma cylindrosporum]|uniref:Calcineurin-like phosphoesterase domain-containing protein n=1 Tax=Hebeloma cylindrosporum TaxID=76867 RepID=A0A0C2YG62_HEBCY|nr:hypothetical protein M413DRAFT_84237 [Hebeloma cylindrosporum h7]